MKTSLGLVGLGVLTVSIFAAGCAKTVDAGDGAGTSGGIDNFGGNQPPSTGVFPGTAGFPVGVGGRMSSSAGTTGSTGTGGMGRRGVAGISPGTGGRGSLGTGGTGGTITVSMCIASADPEHGARPGCTACLCGKDAARTAACSVNCWRLANCVAANCPSSDITCVQSYCSNEISATNAVSQAQATPFAMCNSECLFPAVDAGTGIDAGN